MVVIIVVIELILLVRLPHECLQRRGALVQHPLGDAPLVVRKGLLRARITHMYMHIYIYIYVYVYTHIYTHTDTYKASLSLSLSLSIYIHIYVSNVYTYIYIYIYMYVYIYIYICIDRKGLLAPRYSYITIGCY